MNLETVLHFVSNITPVSPSSEATTQTGDFLSLFVFIALALICICISAILVAKNRAINFQGGVLIGYLTSSKVFIAIFTALAIAFVCLGFCNTAFASSTVLNTPAAPNVVNGYVQDDGSVKIDSYDIVIGENGCNFKDLQLTQICEGDLGNWVIQFNESTVYEGPINGAVIPLDSFKLTSGTVITVKLACDMNGETAKSLVDKDIFSTSISYKNVYTATVDFGEGTVAEAQEGWETITASKIFTKDYEDNIDCAAVVAEWANATVTPPTGFNYDGLTPNTGILTTNTTFSALYSEVTEKTIFDTETKVIEYSPNPEFFHPSDVDTYNLKVGDTFNFYITTLGPEETTWSQFKFCDSWWENTYLFKEGLSLNTDYVFRVEVTQQLMDDLTNNNRNILFTGAYYTLHKITLSQN